MSNKRKVATRKALRHSISTTRETYQLNVPEDISSLLRSNEPMLTPVSSQSPTTSLPSAITPEATGVTEIMETYVDRIAPNVVGITCWFDPGPEPVTRSVTLRFTGRRLGKGPPFRSGDHFIHDQTIHGIVGGSGPIAVTTKIRDINAGQWSVDATMIAMHTPNANSISSENTVVGRGTTLPVYLARWSWLRWRVTQATDSGIVSTRIAPLVPTPAVILGSWAACVFLGILLALLTQSWVISTQGLQLSHVLTVSILSVLGGAIGAKVWFIIIHRNDGRREGWGIQGMVTGITLVALPLLTAWNMPVGTFLDTTTPGLMFGLATGRIGCFFTGCCAGKPTRSRWAIWSSNRSIGARRVPTQLMESFLAFMIGITALATVLLSSPHHGTLFVAAVAAYTLIRQALLLLREERRQSRLGVPIIAAAAGFVLIADVVGSLIVR